MPTSPPQLPVTSNLINMNPGVTMTFQDSVHKDHSGQMVSFGATVTIAPLIKGFGVLNHYHKNHDEVFIVLEGEVEMYVKHVGESKGVTRRISPANGVQHFAKGVVHGFNVPQQQMQVVFSEGTSPKGAMKEGFFRNMTAGGRLTKNPLNIIPLAIEGDTYIPLPGPFSRERGEKIFEKLGHFVGFINRLTHHQPIHYTEQDIKEQQEARVQMTTELVRLEQAEEVAEQRLGAAR